MNPMLRSSLLLGCGLAAFSHGTSAEKKRPMNVLFIAVDDLKPTIGAYGDPIAVTPGMDKLARDGVVFGNTYCQQAISAATRASIMTGMRPDKTRIWDLVTYFRQVNPRVVTMPEYFKDQGYETAAIGKIYHAGAASGRGHDEPSWSVPYTDVKAPAYALPVTLNARNRAQATECADVADTVYKDGKVAVEAMSILGRLAKGEKPFFFAVGFARPHLPFNAPKRYWDLYERNKMPVAAFQRQALNSPDQAYHQAGELKSYTDIPQFDSWSEDASRHLPVEKQKELIHGYYASVSYMDAQVLKLLNELERLGLRENTIVVLWGDHGWHLGDHGLWNKHTNFEQATRVPLFISVPGRGRGVSASTPSEFTDVFPTLCELTGLATPAWLEGVSLVRALDAPDAKLREYALSQYPRGKEVMGYSIRTDRFRYTEWFDGGWKTDRPYDASRVVARELYDYRNDPLETENVVDKGAYEKDRRALETLFVECMRREYDSYVRYAKRADFREPINVNKKPKR